MNKELRAALREAYLTGALQVEGVDPVTGQVSHFPLSGVVRHHTPHKRMLRVVLGDGSEVRTTEDHSLFRPQGDGMAPVASRELQTGDVVASVKEGVLLWTEVTLVEPLPSEEYTYDLSVPGPENFVLVNGVVAHNSYSIGGVSLDLDKSSKYESLKSNAEQQFDKATEAKARTVKYILGLQQPRYGIGVRSAFGPMVGRGVTSPRNFV